MTVTPDGAMHHPAPGTSADQQLPKSRSAKAMAVKTMPEEKRRARIILNRSQTSARVTGFNHRHAGKLHLK